MHVVPHNWWYTDQVSKNPQFRRLRLAQQRYSHRLRKLVINGCKSSIDSLARDRNLALGVRGSFARGDCDEMSDLDFVLLHNGDGPVDVSDLKSKLSPSCHLRMSVDTWTLSNLATLMGQLYFWLALPNIRYIAGSKVVYASRVWTFLRLLSEMNSNALVDLYYNGDTFRDVGTLHSSSHYYWDRKRGIGSFVDAEYCSLVEQWLRIRQKPAQVEIHNALKQSAAAYRYLAALKFWVRILKPRESHATETRWSADRTDPMNFGTESDWIMGIGVERCVRQEHHSAVGIVNQTLLGMYREW